MDNVQVKGKDSFSDTLFVEFCRKRQNIVSGNSTSLNGKKLVVKGCARITAMLYYIIYRGYAVVFVFIGG
jgi:hypothetical protein